jgi:hypothetical protein
MSVTFPLKTSNICGGGECRIFKSFKEKEDAMETYREAKRLMFRRTVLIASLIAAGLSWLLESARSL